MLGTITLKRWFATLCACKHPASAWVLPFLLLTIICASQVWVCAQEPGDDVEVLKVSTDLLVFPARVLDKHRLSVPDLTLSDFFFEDRDGITTGRYFLPSEGRVSLVFALDESGSLRQIISTQRNAAVALFSRFKENSRVAVLRFSDRAKLVVPFNDKPEEASRAFSFGAGPNQRTAIFNAASAAISAFQSLPKDPAERRLVILISDGLDNASSIKPTDVIESAVSSNVSFYVIHLPLFEPRDGRLAVRRPARGFVELAERTGGKYFLAGNAKSALIQSENIDLAPIFQAIEEDIKSQYLLGFYVGERARDGRTHRVSIGLSRSGLTYSVAGRKFSRKHDFTVNLQPRSAVKTGR
jgi:Ca-activated chloride channel family protein